MTRKEFTVLCKGMKAVYPQPTFLPDADAYKVWYRLLEDLDYTVAQAAVQKYMLTNKFPPSVADIRECAVLVRTGDKKTWSEGWEEVMKAIRNFGSYREEEALESMSEITRKAVKKLGFRNICLSENITADRANFRTIYEQMAENEYTAKQIPLNLSKLIENIQQTEQQKRIRSKDQEKS